MVLYRLQEWLDSEIDRLHKLIYTRENQVALYGIEVEKLQTKINSYICVKEKIKELLKEVNEIVKNI